MRDLIEIAKVTLRPRTETEVAKRNLSMHLKVAFFCFLCGTARCRASLLCQLQAVTKCMHIITLVIHHAEGEIHVRLITCGKCETIKQPISKDRVSKINAFRTFGLQFASVA